MCHKMGCCCTKSAVLFKLSMLGVMGALALTVAGLFWPFNAITVPFPLAWALALLILVPSITLYFDVKERFWAEVIEWKAKEKKDDKKP
jgi:hypothetical protein